MSLNKKITLLFPLSLILYELPLYLSNNLFLPALPEITKSFHVINATAQLSIAFWFLGGISLPSNIRATVRSLWAEEDIA